MGRLRLLGLAGLIVAGLAPALRAEITVQFDYTYDTGFFTDHPERQATLQFAADSLTRFLDNLDAITPSGGNTWKAQIARPDTGALLYVPNPAVPADTLIVYVGARDMSDALGKGGPGGYTASGSPAWLNTVSTRGEANATCLLPTDQGKWGGHITFDAAPDWDWYFGLDPAGLAWNEADFLSVASHELGHVLGIGINPANGCGTPWGTYVLEGPNRFTGPESVAEYGDDVPLGINKAHWAMGTMSEVDGVAQETAMSPVITIGTRKLFTDLDYAGLDDVGWDVVSSQAAWSGAASAAWHTGGNWSTALPPTPSSTAIFDGTPGNQPVLGQDADVRQIDFRSAGWTLGGTGTLHVYWGGGQSAGSGTNTVTAPVTMGTACTWTIGPGNTLALTGGLDAAGFTVTKNGAGTLELAGAAAARLDILAGTVRMANDATGPLVIEELAIDAAAALDLTTGNLVVDYDAASPYAAVEAMVTAGFNGGAWNSTGAATGITTSAGDATNYALAIVDNNDADGGGMADLEGEPVDATSVLVKYTFYADADLNGTLDAADVNRLVLSFGGLLADPTPRWASCDYNYDGFIDAADVNLLVLAFASHAGEPHAGGDPVPVGGAVPTPEPATLALLGLGAAAMIARRKQRG